MPGEALDESVPDVDRSTRPAQPVLIVVVLAAMISVGGFTWASTRPLPHRSCKLSGLIGAPVATSPQAAFDAWWTEDGPGAMRFQTTMGPNDGRTPSRDDFTRVSETFWEWRYADNRSIGVHVGPPEDPAAPGSWTVVGVNQCGYGS